MPAVSVIIPTYNCASFLRESLDSVLAQTMRDLEIVVVDDGSTDDTPAVLAGYGDRLRVVAGGHGGLSAARNLGLDAAGGDWIAFHDADDVALPGRLASHLARLQADPTLDAIFCDGERMDAPDAPVARVIPPALTARCAGRILDARDLFAGFPVYFQGALVRRRAFAAAGRFDASYPVQPDLEYGYRLFDVCRAAYADEVVFRYRVHPSNTSGNRFGGREDIARTLEALPSRVPRAAALIGAAPLRARIARHYFRLGGLWRARGDRIASRRAFQRAAALEPTHLRYQWMRLRSAF